MVKFTISNTLFQNTSVLKQRLKLLSKLKIEINMHVKQCIQIESCFNVCGLIGLKATALIILMQYTHFSKPFQTFADIPGLTFLHLAVHKTVPDFNNFS